MSTLKEPRLSPFDYLGRNPKLAKGIAERLSGRDIHIQDFTELAEKLPRINGAPSKTRYRILIVDDERKGAREADRILTQDNMQTRLEQDPMSVLDAIAELGPEIG